MTKSEIRLWMKEKRNTLSKEERKKCNQYLYQRLLNLKEYQDCRNLFTYVSFGSEMDTIAIIKYALKDNKKVYVPRVEGKEMQFYLIDSLDTLIQSNYGILEPKIEENLRYKVNITNREFTNPFVTDQKEMHENLMLLPGLAFDKQGNRIGYGAGFYDKYLEHFPENYFLKVAIAYDFQIVDQIVATVFDKKADMIITPDRCICAKEAF